ncbi:MAG: hypothetical protein GDA35_09510 [Hyphomonadaceae bacterium]|nr:hypothetical protein [Hyphomonadaceae bacterium]
MQVSNCTLATRAFGAAMAILPHLLKGCTAVRVLADKACSGETNRAVLARQSLKSGDRISGETEPSAKRLAEEVQPSGGDEPAQGGQPH